MSEFINIKSLLLKIELDNKYIFWSIIICLVFMLTHINNYFFYTSTKTIESKIEISNLAKNIHFNYYECMHSYNTQEFCVQKVGKYIETLKPFGIIEIKQNDQILFTYNNTKERHLDRDVVVLDSAKLKHFQNENLTLDIKKHTIPSILITTIKSMTFSIYDFFLLYSEKGLTGGVKTYIDEKLYLRSQAPVAFFIFIVIYTWLIKNQQLIIKSKLNYKEEEIVLLSQGLKKAKIETEELAATLKEIKLQHFDMKDKIEKYQNIMNPPFDANTYNALLNLDPQSVIVKCRTALEILVKRIFNIYFPRDTGTLDDMLKRLNANGIINKKILNYANTVKAFGNTSVHPDIKNPIKFDREDAIIISNALILFVEEINKNNNVNL